jgi:hypothetical protein
MEDWIPNLLLARTDLLSETCTEKKKNKNTSDYVNGNKPCGS